MMATISRTSQCSAGKSVSANDVSELSPACHSTYPPHTQRQAEPEPWRAKMLSSFCESFRPAARVAAIVSAANAELELDKPVAAGNVFWETTLANVLTPAR